MHHLLINVLFGDRMAERLITSKDDITYGDIMSGIIRCFEIPAIPEGSFVPEEKSILIYNLVRTILESTAPGAAAKIKLAAFVKKLREAGIVITYNLFDADNVTLVPNK